MKKIDLLSQYLNEKREWPDEPPFSVTPVFIKVAKHAKEIIEEWMPKEMLLAYRSGDEQEQKTIISTYLPAYMKILALDKWTEIENEIINKYKNSVIAELIKIL
jgi:hypothetical protein